ncbi:TPA: hypothetical protein MII19_15960 [Klebsiella pneumoniae]|mgnify:CR=1 FL=1|uniref:hypothetical protein n=1 Tax=Klebsiella pneumoniae TaxID=573 RepID=UPI003AFCAEAD|nr:hypothetical protein [Klebsiella pneumoniae]HBX8481248.1 hypothetical protein [Klebsiella pneumoniae]HBX8491782.1 hypothetical protein [Klebsiella pneumoniae]HCJ1549544.1 hypothetical protein [Klebsiella pneumoniae]HCJ1810609.1 hypothetical protein [Klebsiella pneumoniae]
MNTKKLTIVWLQQTISDIQTRRDNGSVSWDDERENILQAFEIALAAMCSEPVGEFYEDGPLNWYQISDGDRVPSHRRIPLYRHAQPARDSCAIADVIAERIRQQSVEGFSTEQDDTYVGCQLAAAAICYIEPMEAENYWPADWYDDSFKPTNERRNLVKAAALIIAEIERLDRKSNTELKNE